MHSQHVHLIQYESSTGCSRGASYHHQFLVLLFQHCPVVITVCGPHIGEVEPTAANTLVAAASEPQAGYRHTLQQENTYLLHGAESFLRNQPDFS
jgi:hypothetical protein